jgi:hypothetical protein
VRPNGPRKAPKTVHARVVQCGALLHVLQVHVNGPGKQHRAVRVVVGLRFNPVPRQAAVHERRPARAVLPVQKLIARCGTGSAQGKANGSAAAQVRTTLPQTRRATR